MPNSGIKDSFVPRYNNFVGKLKAGVSSTEANTLENEYLVVYMIGTITGYLTISTTQNISSGNEIDSIAEGIMNAYGYKKMPVILNIIKLPI